MAKYAGEWHLGDQSGGTAGAASLAAWLPALGLLAASFAGLCWLELQPVDENFVAAVFPPWWSEARSIAAVTAADGAILGWGRPRSIVITRSNHPGFAERLHDAGAVLLIEPSYLSGCSTSTRKAIGNNKNLEGEGKA
jgi:hypothetical protein